MNRHGHGKHHWDSWSGLYWPLNRQGPEHNHSHYVVNDKEQARLGQLITPADTEHYRELLELERRFGAQVGTWLPKLQMVLEVPK